LRFNNIPKSSIEIIKDIASLQRLSKLRQHAVTCQFQDDFINHLVQHIPEQKWRKQSKRTRRGTDEAFFGLMKVSGQAVLKLIGIHPEDARHYICKSIVLKEKKLEPDIVGYPVLESNDQKVFIEFQAYEHPFIKYNIVSKALMASAQDNDKGHVHTVIIYTEQKYKDAALPIKAFGKPADEIFDQQIKELVLTNYTLDELLKIDPRLIILAPFTVPTDLPLSTLTTYGRQWKKTIDTAYSLTDLNDAINVMSLFFLNRFRNITREGIKAMLDFDILDTVAGRQVYDEGLEKGLEKGRDEGLKEGRDEGLKEGRLINMREMLALNLKNRFGNVSSDVMQSLSSIKDFEFLKTLFSESYSYDNYDLIKKRLSTVLVSGSDQTNYIK
jgi:hypothetical protein